MHPVEIKCHSFIHSFIHSQNPNFDSSFCPFSILASGEEDYLWEEFKELSQYILRFLATDKFKFELKEN